jgi:glycosyltransferase involved in cell wall biosynthesis
MSAPAVSVVIPVRDGERYIGDALDSVTAQRYEPAETIVVDDGSSDRSAAIARRHGAQVIASEGRGVAHARNLGVVAARGELIAFLDADDVWTRGSLSLRVEYLETRPELGCVFGRIQEFVDPATPPRLRRGLVTDERVGTMSTFIGRRAVFAKVGGFDESLAIGEDLDWIARVQDGGIRRGYIDQVCALRRLHPASTTALDPDLTRRSLTRVLRTSLNRRRSAERI